MIKTFLKTPKNDFVDYYSIRDSGRAFPARFKMFVPMKSQKQKREDKEVLGEALCIIQILNICICIQ